MNNVKEFLMAIKDDGKRERLSDIFTWIAKNYPQLTSEIKWNQPMFMDHGTFILAFSVAKGHVAIAPEQRGIATFLAELRQADYNPTTMMFRIRWEQAVDYDLLKRIIDFNIEDKKNCATFWRQQP